MIKGAHVTIRTVREADLELLMGLMSDLDNRGDFLPAVMRSEAGLKKEFYENGFIGDSLSRYVILSENSELIGILWVFKSVPYFDALEIGYQIFNGSDRRRGFATEAVSLLIKYLFESTQVNRLEIRVAVGNVASIKVASKAGFILEGTHREAAFSKGRLHDMHTFALIRKDWFATSMRQD